MKNTMLLDAVICCCHMQGRVAACTAGCECLQSLNIEADVCQDGAPSGHVQLICACSMQTLLCRLFSSVHLMVRRCSFWTCTA